MVLSGDETGPRILNSFSKLSLRSSAATVEPLFLKFDLASLRSPVILFELISSLRSGLTKHSIRLSIKEMKIKILLFPIW